MATTHVIVDDSVEGARTLVPDTGRAASSLGGSSLSARAAGWIAGVLDDVLPDRSAAVERVDMLRDGAKQLALITLADERRWALKQYADDRGYWTRKWTRRLTDAGFGPGAALGVTPVVGWCPHHRTMINDVAPGMSWSGWLAEPAPRRAAAARVAADWLVALQSSDVALPDRTQHRAAREMRQQSEALSQCFPRHAAPLIRTADRAGRRLEQANDCFATDLVVSHGDLHPNNIHIWSLEPPAATALDLDTVGLRTPAYDAGYAISHLLVFSWMRTASFRAGAGSALAFWDRWSSQVDVDTELVAAEIVRGLIQSLHFELVTYDTGRSELLALWLDLAEAMLSHGVGVTLQTLAATEVRS